MRHASPPSPDLGDFLDREVFPALWLRLDQAFPEFGFVRRSTYWLATREEGSRALPGAPRPDRVWVYEDTPFGLKIHGGEFVPWLRYLSKGAPLRGLDYVEMVRQLAQRAGVPFVERELTPEALHEARQREQRCDLLEAFCGLAVRALQSEQGSDARRYLQERGFAQDRLEELEFGLYPSAAQVERELVGAGFGLEEVREAAVIPPAFDEGTAAINLWSGRVVGPWRDRAGRIITLWSRDIFGLTDPAKKYLLLRGGSRQSPFGLHRVRGAEVLMVEGIIDALALQAAGVENVVALGGAALGAEQLACLERAGVTSTTLNLDFDPSAEPCRVHGATLCEWCYPGLAGTLQAVERLSSSGLSVYVVDPALMAANGNVDVKADPDSFLRREGVTAYHNLVRSAVPGPEFWVRTSLDRADLDTPRGKDRAVEDALNWAGGFADPRHREQVWRLVSARTGYSPETLAELWTRASEVRTEEARRRELSRLLDEARTDLTRGASPTAAAAAGLAADLQRFTTSHEPEALQPFCVEQLMGRVREVGEGKRSGWGAVDALGLRFHPSELAVVGARTGHGKTTFLLSLLQNWLVRYRNETACLYSFELPPEAVFLKLASALTRRLGGQGWTYYEIRDWLQSGQRHDGYPPAASLDAALDELRGYEGRLEVVYEPGWTVQELCAHARGVGERRAVGAVLVDYLQLVRPPEGQYDRRDIEVSQVARRLKALAVELNCPVVAAAQIGRQAAQQSERVPAGDFNSEAVRDAIRRRRPQLHHLREGGSEQEADVVLGLLNYRADYLEDQERTDPQERNRPGPLEVLVLKNRFGELGLATLILEGPTGTVRDMDASDELD